MAKDQFEFPVSSLTERSCEAALRKFAGPTSAMDEAIAVGVCFITVPTLNPTNVVTAFCLMKSEKCMNSFAADEEKWFWVLATSFNQGTSISAYSVPRCFLNSFLILLSYSIFPASMIAGRKEV